MTDTSACGITVARGCSRSLTRQAYHGLWKPRFHALFAPRYGGGIFNLAALDDLTPCVADDDHSPAYTAETALERAARHARERGGTVQLDCLRAEEARNYD